VGPITLFDKSFLQSLSVDESVWFDHFFLTNICPLFYVETLADLEKSVRDGRTPEQEIGIIADKFPEMHGSPSAHHASLCIANLLGDAVPMTGQIPPAGGRLVKDGSKTGVVYEQSPEAKAFSRWQRGQFMEIERQYAQAWRRTLSNQDWGKVAKGFRAGGIDRETCNTLEEARDLAKRVISSRDKPFENMDSALVSLNVPQHFHPDILKCWRNANCPALVDYAPYAAYVMMVEIFFHLALAANLISSERPSNRVDITYLFYLPFCMMFVSSDRLHRKCVPLFLRNDQEFVWGQDLKEGLRHLNTHYSQLPDSTKERGIMSFAVAPPKEGDFYVAHLWDRFLPKWRERKKVNLSGKSVDDQKIVEEIKKMTDALPLSPEEVNFDPTDIGSFAIEHLVAKKKGSWYQVAKDCEVPENQQ